MIFLKELKTGDEKMTKYFHIEELRKAVKNIEDKVIDIRDTLKDLSMKLCYLIKDRRSYQDMIEGNEFPA